MLGFYGGRGLQESFHHANRPATKPDPLKWMVQTLVALEGTKSKNSELHHLDLHPGGPFPSQLRLRHCVLSIAVEGQQAMCSRRAQLQALEDKCSVPF